MSAKKEEEAEKLVASEKESDDIPGNVTVVTGGVTMPTGVAVGVLVQPPTHLRNNPSRLSLQSRASDPEIARQQKDVKGDDDDYDDDEAETATQKRSNQRTMQALEMEYVNPLKVSRSEDEDDDDEHVVLTMSTDSSLDDDMEGLLPDVVPPPKRKKARIRDPMCWSSQKIGNTTVFWPALYHKTGFGMIGPHFLGPPCVLLLLWSASWYFIRTAWMHVGWMTSLVCIGFTVTATYHLCNCCLRDPGIVRPLDCCQGQQRPPPPDRHHRWCDLCQAYQPPTGAHCPECNVCVAGYDHHCAWMGCCIGQRNYQPFLKFNMTWLLYLSYAVIWVSLLGPILFGPHGHDSKISATQQEEHIFVSDEGGENRAMFFLR